MAYTPEEVARFKANMELARVKFKAEHADKVTQFSQHPTSKLVGHYIDAEFCAAWYLWVCECGQLHCPGKSLSIRELGDVTNFHLDTNSVRALITALNKFQLEEL